VSTDTWWTIRQALVEYRDKDFSSATNEQIHAMTDALAADLESQLAEQQQQPAPVSATEPDAVRMLREGMRGQHALFNVNQEYVCAVAPLLEYIDALTARLAEAERVTEEQVLAMRVIGMTDAESLTCVPQADGMLVISAVDDDGKTYALDLQSLFKALTAARGGG